MNELMELLAKRDIDFVLAFKPIQSLPDVESHILFQNSLSAIVGNNHPLASEENVSVAELENTNSPSPQKDYKPAMPSTASYQVTIISKSVLKLTRSIPC